MTTCTCTTPCTTCTCDTVSDEVVAAYQELKEFINKNYADIRSMILAELQVREQILEGVTNNVYYLEDTTLQSISKRYLLENTLKVWQEPQQYLIPKICRDIVLNILREVFIRAEEPWKVIYPANKLHMKVSVGDINFGIIYTDIKAFPEMEFSSYDDLFEGLDLVPNYRLFDRTPYGTMMNWFVNIDWIRFLSKSVNIAPSVGSDDYEVPITEVLKGWMIYRCIRMALEDIVLTMKTVKVGDRIVLYNQVYELGKILGKATDDIAFTIGFKKISQ
jgi:hypothetical protein